MKYPSLIAGSISASAPLLAFRGETPAWDSGSYYRVITRTAEHYSPFCASNIRAAFPLMLQAGATALGRANLQAKFKLCKKPETSRVGPSPACICVPFGGAFNIYGIKCIITCA